MAYNPQMTQIVADQEKTLGRTSYVDIRINVTCRFSLCVLCGEFKLPLVAASRQTSSLE